MTTRVPAGVRDGQKIRLRGKGSPGPGGNGDLILTITVEPHPLFGRDARDPDNLTLTLPVTFPEAALGAQVEVPTFDGSTVTVKLPPGTPSGRVLRVKGRGVRRKDGSVRRPAGERLGGGAAEAGRRGQGGRRGLRRGDRRRQPADRACSPRPGRVMGLP